MWTRERLFVGTALLLAVGTADVARAKEARRRPRVARVVDLLGGAAREEYADWALVAFDGPGSVVGAWSVNRPEGDMAVACRRVDADTGALSATTRVEYPGRPGQNLFLDGMVVGDDGVATVAVRVAGYPDDTFDNYRPLDEQLLRFSRDGALVARLSLGAPANHVRLVAHDGVVDVAFDAQLTRDGDRAAWWRRVGSDGAFAGDAVRLSAPAASPEPVVRVGIWDVFLGVDAGGTARVIYRRITFRGELGEAVVEPPELFWCAVSPTGVASASVSLGVSYAQLLDADFAADGAACIVRTPSDGSDAGRGTSFLDPLLVSREGALVAPAGPVVPWVISSGTGEKIAVGADASSTFHPLSIASEAWRGRIDHGSAASPEGIGPYLDPPPVVDSLRRIPRSLFAGTLASDGAVPSTLRGVRLRPTEVTAHRVAPDGTIAIAGFGRRSIDVALLGPGGRPRGGARFALTPGPTMDFSPVLATTGTGASLRCAVAWTSNPDDGSRPSRRFPARLRVAILK